ncbi:MAG: hypothetical protein LQ342_003247 [Letrouitia transgressa]|nr:MAG: hypothetical protein LQ342_003247 [Letrouitia transgressa]
MPDIRSFFGGKENQNAISSQERPKQKGSEDSPVGKATTASDYFATSSNSKPARSTINKPETPGKRELRDRSSYSTPVKKSSSGLSQPSSGRASTRKKDGTNHSLELIDSGKQASRVSAVKNDDSSDEDLTIADPRRKRVGVTDEGKGGNDDELPTRTRGTPKNRKVVNGHSEAGAITKKSRTTGAGKRKSAEPDTDEEILPSSRKKASRTKNTPKKGSPQKAQTEANAPERSAVQDIFDSIPTVRPPTPPKDAKTGETKKFDFRTAASRNQPAPAAGSIEIPEGAENCLAGLSFVFTGLLDALGREEGQELVKRYGGKVTTGPSSKTSYVVLGTDAGPKKLETIEKFKLKTINEVGLFELIRQLPANGGDSKAATKFEEKRKQEEMKNRELAAEMEEEDRKAANIAEPAKDDANGRSRVAPSNGLNSSHPAKKDSRLWIAKYAPTATSMICGNKGQVEKLQTWLRGWPKSLRAKFKMPGRDGLGLYRAVIIHGPPGIGKTTAAHLVARLEGYDIVESNASDTRSKKLVETGLKGVLDTTSLLGYFAGDGKKVETEKRKIVLIMDEVDGMSSGDRGGVGALAAVCKKTRIPMILICNDRRLPKMAPFDRVTYDLPFRRPTLDQIRSRIMTICYREQLKIPPNVVNALIEGSHADIRQVINMLSTAKLDQEAMDFNTGNKMSKDWQKHVVLKPWDIVSKILGGGLFAASSKASLNDKIELYFNDHEFSSLMLQENYLGTQPIIAQTYSGKERSLKLLELCDRAAESISDGDLVDRMIHGTQQQWALMPTHAVFSFVRPASFVSGSQAGHQTRFTSWLGNNSKSGKLARFIKEIQGHMRLRSSGDRHQIRQEYLPLLWQKLVKYLDTQGKEGVPDVISIMDSYYLTKDDWDAMVELGVGPMDETHVKLDTQTKATFTRLYNQQSHPLPFMKASQIVAPKKTKREVPDLEEAIGSSDEGDAILSDEDAQLSDEEQLDLKKDKYVKAPSKKRSEAGKAPKNKANKTGKSKTHDVQHDMSGSDEEIKPRRGQAQAKRRKVKG